MKRLHVHVAVRSIEESVGFYSQLFAQPPTVLKDDYAKWMLDDPRVNFAISQRGREPGLDHLGIQVENADELAEVTARLKAADIKVMDQGEATCCYAKSEKAWIVDPQQIAWETFLTKGESTVYGNDNEVSGVPMAKPKTSCCATDESSVAVEIKSRG